MKILTLPSPKCDSCTARVVCTVCPLVDFVSKLEAAGFKPSAHMDVIENFRAGTVTFMQEDFNR